MSNKITLIEQSISGDMTKLSGSVETMSKSLLMMDMKVGTISNDVNKMSNMMGGMRYDIHRGTESFTSPLDYMRNMMQ